MVDHADGHGALRNLPLRSDSRGEPTLKSILSEIVRYIIVEDAKCHNKKRMARMTHGMWRALSAAGVAFALTASSAVAKPDSDLSFLVGVEDAEDLLLIPGTDWIVASGMGRDKPHGALAPDQRSHQGLEPLVSRPASARPTGRPRLSRLRHPARPRPLLVAGSEPSGRGVRAPPPSMSPATASAKRSRCSMSMLEARRHLFIWKGCARMPEGLAANSVTSTPSGVLLASVSVSSRQDHGRLRRRPGDGRGLSART
jgi:hypothetical protein